jgi:TonB-dependent receptor
MKQQILISCSLSLLASAICAGLSPAHAADLAAPAPTAASAPGDGSVPQNQMSSADRKSDASKAVATTADKKSAVTLSAVSVTGQLASLQRAQAIKRDAIGIVDSVSAEETGKFPDQNVADALQRVPGISVDRSGGESNQITVRGFGPTFVNVLLNGRPLASSATNRAFNFDVMPTSIISTAIVSKTASAKQEEGGIGGTVDIVTARPFDFNGFHATGTVGGVYDNLGGGSSSNSATPKFSAMLGNTNKDHTFGWLASVLYEKRDHTEQSVNTSGWIPGLNYSSINPAYTNVSIPQTLQGSVLNETRTRRSFNGSIDWIPIDHLTVKFDTFLSNYKVDSKYNAFGLYANPSDIQSLTADANGTAISYTRKNTGALSNDYIMESNPSNEYNEQTGINLAYAFSDATTLSLDSSVSKAWNKQSANGYFTVLGTRNIGINPVFTNNGPNLLPSTTNILSPTDANTLHAHYFGLGGQSPNVSDRVMQTRLDLSTGFTEGVLSELDFGVQHTEQQKKQANIYTPNAVGCSEYCGYVATVPGAAVGAYVFNAGSLVDGVSPGFPQQWLGYDVNKMLTYLASPAAYNQLPNPSAYQAALAANGGFTPRLDPNSYSSVLERTNSAYGQASFDGEMGTKSWTLNVGLRYTQTDTISGANTVPITAITVNPLDTSNAIPTYGPLAPVQAKGSYSNWLPSADFKINLRDDLIFRAAASKTMARPDLTNLSAASSYNFRPQNQTVSKGNVNLLPYVSTNYDASLEWYINSDSYVALDGFVKDVKNFTTLVTTPTNILGFPFLLTQPVNLNAATIKGAEFTFNYQFHQLPAPFDGLGTAFNYTYVTSSTSVNGTSSTGKFAVPGIGNSSNVSLYYQKGPIQTRLAYNWRAKYLSTIAGDQSQPTTVKPYGEVDFSASYKINPHVSVFVNATNLFNQTIFRYQVYANRPSYAEKDGRTFMAGVRASL